MTIIHISFTSDPICPLCHETKEWCEVHQRWVCSGNGCDNDGLGLDCPTCENVDDYEHVPTPCQCQGHGTFVHEHIGEVFCDCHAGKLAHRCYQLEMAEYIKAMPGTVFVITDDDLAAMSNVDMAPDKAEEKWKEAVQEANDV